MRQSGNLLLARKVCSFLSNPVSLMPTQNLFAGTSSYEILNHVLNTIEEQGHIYQAGLYFKASDERAIQIMNTRGRRESEEELGAQTDRLLKRIRRKR